VIRAKNALASLFRKVASGLLFVVPQRLLVRLLPARLRFDPSRAVALTTPRPGESRLLVGPANAAGQSWAIAHAIDENLPDVGAVSMSAAVNPRFNFPADYTVPIGAYHWSKAWQRSERLLVEGEFSHVLVESGRRMFGDGFPGSAASEIADLRRHGVRVGLLFYGSDIRLPSRHALASAWSPFRDELWSLTPQLQSVASRNARLVETSGCPAFVVTPDLLLDLANATWVPLVIDTAAWATDTAPLSGSRIPRVAHAPTSSAVKGSDLVDPILARLESEGLVEYVRVSGVSAAEMRSIYKGVDIVLDQFRMGIYGVAACEAMAAGRIVVSHVGEFTRRYVAEKSGRTLPIVEATPDTLEGVLREILGKPAKYLQLAKDGVAYAGELHDGRRSAEALQSFLAS
jgi:hypothetical protein